MVKIMRFGTSHERGFFGIWCVNFILSFAEINKWAILVMVKEICWLNLIGCTFRAKSDSKEDA